MNVEKERRLITKKKLEFNHEDANHLTGEPSPKLAVNDVDEPGTNAGQSGLVESGGNKEMVNPVEGQGCNEYEMQRNKNIAKNQEKFAALGIPILTKSVSEKGKRELKQPNEAAGESDYLPSNEDGGESENDEVDIATSKKIKRTKRQRVVQSTTDGPRTRGQAAKLVDKSQNKEAASEPLPVEKNDAHVPTAKERLQALKSGPGSMLAYNKLREREKLQIETEVAEGESGTQQMMAESGDTPSEQLERLDNLPIGIEDDEAEELLKISDADVYLKTRKRDKTREYKLTEKEAEELDKRFNPDLKINLDESDKSTEAEVEAESVETDHE
ncbi:hypothetical protein DCAR_0623620 [Daucus carota subsp. sativus]|uniref:Uncharacterized protein n=1 Tax=Daucus carota subsp. sativus TaxID=79200 RepID=A0A164VBN6_DAUCS|nr:hypothetical protein DCAR_0623620 [Daucus carota subsp. sativus]